MVSRRPRRQLAALWRRLTVAALRRSLTAGRRSFTTWRRSFTTRRRSRVARWCLHPLLLLLVPLLHLLRLLLVHLFHLLLSGSICVLLLQPLVFLILLLLKPLVFFLLLVINPVLLLLQPLVLLWITRVRRSGLRMWWNFIWVHWRRRSRRIVFRTRNIVIRPGNIVGRTRRIVLWAGPYIGIGTTRLRTRSSRIAVGASSPAIWRWIVRRTSLSCRNRRLESGWPGCGCYWGSPVINRRTQIRV